MSPEAPLRYNVRWLRNADFPDAPQLVLGRIPYGIWSCAAPSGGYKSALLAQIMQHIAYRVPLPGLSWEFLRHGDCLHVTVDESHHDVQERNLRISPWGTLPGDGARGGHGDVEPGQGHIHVVHDPDGGTLAARIAWLKDYIAQMETHTGRHIVMITWDHLGSFLGIPEGRNAYEHAEPLQALNQWCVVTGRILALPNHVGKDHRPIGTVAIDAYSNLCTATDLKHDGSGFLAVRKMRGGPKWRVAIQAEEGLLSFSDQSPHQVAHRPHTRPRQILDIMAGQPSLGGHTAAELAHLLGTSSNAVRVALMRLAESGEIVRDDRGAWYLAVSDARCETPGRARGWPVCDECGYRVNPAGDDGTGCHKECAERARASTSHRPAETPGGATSATDTTLATLATSATFSEEPDPEEEAPGKYRGLAIMKTSIATSRMHPVPYIKVPDREHAPWAASADWPGAEGFDSGDHRYVASGLDPDAMVTLLDRNGSFPSACSSVAVAANILQSTGTDRAELAGRAGMVGIIVPPWEHPQMPHPLGRRAVPGQRLVIATGALEHLDKLAKDDLLPYARIWESWTGRKTSSLFERFYTQVRQDREATRTDADAYAAVKEGSSKAIRLLFPKAARSPFWRPDWYTAIVGEARRRHWIAAYKAVKAGHILVSLSAEDEAAFVLPDGADPDWVPDTYTLGTQFGQIKHKDLLVRPDKVDLSGMHRDHYTTLPDGRILIKPPFPAHILMAVRKAARS